MRAARSQAWRVAWNVVAGGQDFSLEVTENQGHSHSVRVWATQVRSLLENRIAKTTAVDGGATLGPHLGNAPDYRTGMPRKWLVSAKCGQ